MSEAPAGARVQGRTRRGRPCELADCTGDSIPLDVLEALLAELIAADAFDFRASSASGARSAEGATLRLDQPGFGHIQLGERLYRLLVARSGARLEAF